MVRISSDRGSSVSVRGSILNSLEVLEKNVSVQFAVRVVPRASKSEIVGEHDGMLKVRIAAPPVDGAANEEVIKLLARTFKVSKSSVMITSGQTSKTKQVSITGITTTQIHAILKGKTPRDIFSTS